MLAVSVQMWRCTFVVITYCVAFALQGCYTAYVGSSLPTFRDSFAGCGHNHTQPARPQPTALLSPSSDGKPEAATGVVVAPDDGHKDARNMLSCI